MMQTVLDVVGSVLLLVGCLMAFAAGVGLVRLPDVLTRMHAATKPQVLGLLCVLLAVIVMNRAWALLPLALLGWVFMLLTAPVSAHMVGRASYRSKHVKEEGVVKDELAIALRENTPVESQLEQWADGSEDQSR
ncbi:monovalent cation/H(+) antiporter subunit G [Kocuria sp. JC486]|uniref:Monovalent cation/H(+) antiporter subunit G n=2 Tax=Kocuria TaxID=57493 RepID=A0A3N3ZTK4_9MICC|nr:MULTISPECIES: monovalent cation/H(+) antiporter subunit G [Kocuria]NHU85037.1 monovalent cation/H(+) antiporter subunit G [Kocuria sp. JC486]ROZ65630.1 monovalent cation/H(+) antiporter subunit G [Kocuria soli]